MEEGECCTELCEALDEDDITIAESLRAVESSQTRNAAGQIVRRLLATRSGFSILAVHTAARGHGTRVGCEHTTEGTSMVMSEDYTSGNEEMNSTPPRDPTRSML